MNFELIFRKITRKIMIENCMVLLSMKTTGPYLEKKTGCLSNIKKKTLNMSICHQNLF